MKPVKKPIFFTLNNPIPLAEKIRATLEFERGNVRYHRFPDGESYIRIDSDIKDRDIILMENLDYPDSKILSILLFIETAKDLGAKSIGFIAPYLAYLRQDTRFKAGEGITSRYFASILSKHLDWLMTMDPHLHRYQNLNEIYAIPVFTLHAADNVSDWIKNHVSNPVIIGPDVESRQWVENIANKNKTPYLILEKIRHGDKEVEVTMPDSHIYKDHTPILVDDIISTGKTMLAATKNLINLGMSPPICIGVHGIFADNAYEELTKISGVKMITCNTIKHITNAIDVSNRFVECLLSFFSLR